jgi:hypothetical protein
LQKGFTVRLAQQCWLSLPIRISVWLPLAYVPLFLAPVGYSVVKYSVS